jgi:hypothetical protein
VSKKGGKRKLLIPIDALLDGQEGGLIYMRVAFRLCLSISIVMAVSEVSVIGLNKRDVSIEERLKKGARLPRGVYVVRECETRGVEVRKYKGKTQ